MKNFIISLLMICAYSVTYAQQLTVKSVNLRPEDPRASINPRYDAKGKKCAIIRVGIVGVDDLIFPEAIGNVERSLSEYVVYVPDGLKSLNYKSKSGEILGSIVFDVYDLDIKSPLSYDVLLESTDRLRSAIFSIQPSNAKLKFDGKDIEVNKDGIAMINKPVGTYSYMIMADGYLGQSGTVTLTEDDISTLTEIILEQQLYPVTIGVFPDESTVFIDNIPYTKEALSDLKLPEGKHVLRVTAANYQEKESTINVNSSLSPLFISLEEAQSRYEIHEEEQTETTANIRNAFYITGHFAFAGAPNIGKVFDSNNALDFGVELSAVQHFGGIFGIREGIGLFLMKPGGEDKYFDLSVYNDSTHWLLHIDIPLQFGVSIPFGAYNRHLFNVFFGGYGSNLTPQSGSFAIRELSEEEKKRDIKDADKEDKTYWDYGLRLSAKLDIGHFTIGADFSQSLHDMGFSAGVNIGFKLYTLKKKKRKR